MTDRDTDFSYGRSVQLDLSANGFSSSAHSSNSLFRVQKLTFQDAGAQDSTTTGTGMTTTEQLKKQVYGSDDSQFDEVLFLN